MELLSKEYGWTINDIRNQPQDELMAYITIINTRNQLDNAKSKNT